MKGSIKPNKVRNTYVNTHKDYTESFLHLSFGVSWPSTDLSVGVKTASRAPFVFAFSGV